MFNKIIDNKYVVQFPVLQEDLESEDWEAMEHRLFLFAVAEMSAKGFVDHSVIEVDLSEVDPKTQTATISYTGEIYV